MATKESTLIAAELQNQRKSNRDWMVYDARRSTVAVVNNLRFFQQTAGAVGYGLTNMKSAGMIPQGNTFLITEIMFKVMNDDGAPFIGAGGAGLIHPLNAIMSQAYFELKVDPAVLYEAHMVQLYEQINMYEDTSAAANAVTALPAAFQYKTHRMRYPITLFPNRGFSVDLTFTAPGAGNGYSAAHTLFICFLKGILQRQS